MQFNKYTHKHTQTHTHFAASDKRFSLYMLLIPPWKDQCEWHTMTRTTGPDCAVMCNLINKHSHTHTHIENMRPMLGALDETTRAGMSLSTAQVVRQEHRMPLARCLRHALRIFCQAHNALQVASAVVSTTRPSSLPLRQPPSFSTSPQLFYSRRVDALAGRDAITSTQEEN